MKTKLTEKLTDMFTNIKVVEGRDPIVNWVEFNGGTLMTVALRRDPIDAVKAMEDYYVLSETALEFGGKSVRLITSSSVLLPLTLLEVNAIHDESTAQAVAEMK